MATFDTGPTQRCPLYVCVCSASFPHGCKGTTVLVFSARMPSISLWDLAAPQICSVHAKLSICPTLCRMAPFPTLLSLCSRLLFTHDPEHTPNTDNLLPHRQPTQFCPLKPSNASEISLSVSSTSISHTRPDTPHTPFVHTMSKVFFKKVSFLESCSAVESFLF